MYYEDDETQITEKMRLETARTPSRRYKKTSSVNTEPVKIGFAYYLVAALVISLSLAALPNLFLR